MKTNSVVLIGLVVLFVIFGVSSYLQWECAQEIKLVSEYHKEMSIPAIAILNQIQLNFQSMHIVSVENVESDQVNLHVQEGHASYEEGKDGLLDNIEKYNSLSIVKNSHDEFLADEMMQEQMKNYAHFYREIINSNDIVVEQFENGELSNSNAILQLQSIENDFHKSLEKNIQMELNGMEKTQSRITEIERQMERIFFSSGIIAIISTILIIIFTTRFVTNPISKLVGVTKEIGKGKTININKNSRNSDVNNVLVALNQMSKDLEDYREKILKQEKLSTIGELSSRLAHDIRNPLTIIKASMDIMKIKKDLSKDDLDKFQRVDDAIYRITHQVDNVLDFVKGKPLKISKYSLQEIFNSVVEDLPESKKIEFAEQNLEINCDFELIKVVLINLIINANQATDNQSKIKITSEKTDDKIIIQVEDNGPGIPEDQLEKIFEPLYTTKQEGTGLGLASCKSIVEKHGGTISAKNNPTRFIIEIPQSN